MDHVERAENREVVINQSGQKNANKVDVTTNVDDISLRFT